jgi:probable HAF family extracellular repeat protein
MMFKSLTAGVLAAVLSVGTAQAADSPYFFNLLLGPGGSMGTSAAAINDAGMVIGSKTINGLDQAIVWGDSKTATVLPTTVNTYAQAVNSAGQIVGTAGTVADGYNGVSWTHNVRANLAPLAGHASSGAADVNDSGRVVGHSLLKTANGDYFRATVWNGSQATALAKLSAQELGSAALAINNSGLIVGYSATADKTVATVWQGGVATALNSGSSQNSTAFAVNNAGQVAGQVVLGNYQAARWDAGQLTILPTLNGGLSSQAYAINDLGLVVGASWDDKVTNQYRATLWNGTTAIDLNTYLSTQDIALGWVLQSAYGINEKGFIVGNAYNTKTGDAVAYLLSDTSITPAPIPEPGTLALMGLGLAAIAGASRRRVSTPQC